MTVSPIRNVTGIMVRDAMFGFDGVEIPWGRLTFQTREDSVEFSDPLRLRAVRAGVSTELESVVGDLRLECQGCGVSWPADAPDLACTCPPNTDERPEARNPVLDPDIHPDLSPEMSRNLSAVMQIFDEDIRALAKE